MKKALCFFFFVRDTIHGDDEDECCTWLRLDDRSVLVNGRGGEDGGFTYTENNGDLVLSCASNRFLIFCVWGEEGEREEEDKEGRCRSVLHQGSSFISWEKGNN